MNTQERYKLYNALISNGYILHGTNAEFSEFNPRKIVGSNRANEGYGFYFTDEAYKAIEYGDNVKAVKKDDFNFIELTSPIDVDILNGDFINNKIEELNYRIDNFQGDEFDLDSLKMKLNDLKLNKKYYYINDFVDEVNNTINRGAKNYKDLQSKINNPNRYLPMIANILITFKKVNGFHDENVYVIFDFYNLNKKIINNPLELAKKFNKNLNNIEENMNKSIKLTESELHEFIAENVRNIISELDWRTYTSAYEKSKERRNKEEDPYLKSVYNDQTLNFMRQAGKRMHEQYGLDYEDVQNAYRYIEFYKKNGYYSDKLPKPSRKAFKAMSQMLKDKQNFYQGKQEYKDGSWKNK